MTGLITELLRSDEQHLATSRHGDTEQPLPKQYPTFSDTSSHSSVTMEENNEPEVEDAEMEISAAQKMLSAVSGSLLTSLLGTSVPTLNIQQCTYTP